VLCCAVSAAPNKRTTTVVNQQNRVFSSLNAKKTPERRHTRPPSASCFENNKENSDRSQPNPHPHLPHARAGSWKRDVGTCAQRSRTVYQDRQLKAAVRVEGGGSGRLSEPALCCSPCACDRPPFTERAGVVVRALAREKFGRRQWVWCHFALKITRGSGEGRVALPLYCRLQL
jgi:hypothetical protein